MDRRLFDGLVPALYGIVCLAVLLTGGPFGIVAIIGAMLVGLYYGVIRRSIPCRTGEPGQPVVGRQRNRNRNRTA